ncbi:MAG: phosphate acetyltransferase PlsX, partial [Spirochaetes bacterium]|nr:phosphate acetyltransferase PlsX [Spirochaetota bacterium]
MRIGIDIESGENSFTELVNGALIASQHYPDTDLFLIGNVKNVIKNFPEIESNPRISLVHAHEMIAMDEAPISALKQKNNATVNVGARMVKNQTIDLFFSPGNTGATVAAASLELKKL